MSPGRVIGLVAVVMAHGCDPPSAAPSAAIAAPNNAGHVSPPFDIGRVIRQVHFAFRQERDGFGGGDTSYAVHASGRGSVQVVPRSATAVGAPLELETAVIRRAAPLPVDARSVHSDPRGVLDIDRGVVVEHLQNVADGLEQSWRFRSAPDGAGDLVIVVRATGPTFAGETPKGLHFIDSRTGLGVRYGRATWIDASNKRTPIETRWTSNGIELRVPAQVVEQASFPATVDPIVSPELGMDQTLFATALNFQGVPDVASDGANYLVTWHDERNVNGPWIEFDIFAARVTALGDVLDPAGIQLTTGRQESYAPKVVWDGTSYLVVWLETELTFRFMRAARVRADGVVASTFDVSNSTVAGNGYAIAAATTSCLVVWEDYQASSTTGVDLLGALIANGGGLVNTTDLPITSDMADQVSPTLASTGTEFLVAWADDRAYATTGYDLYALRLDLDANVMTAEMPLSIASGHQTTPTVASDGNAYLVAWSDSRNAPTAGPDVYGARIDDTGVLDPNGVALAGSTDDEYRPDVVADQPGMYSLVWADSGSAVSGTTVRADATTLAAGSSVVITTTADTRFAPAIASNGSGHLVTWTDTRDPSTQQNVYAARLDSSGALLDASGFPVALAMIRQYAPTVASNGSDYLVAWEDARSGSLATTSENRDVWGVRVDASGLVLDPSGIPISTARLNQRAPKIASNGADFFVVWYDYRDAGDNPTDTIPPQAADIYGARVSAAGVVLDPDGIAVAVTAADELRPTISSNGADYFVAWQQDYYSTSIRGTRVMAVDGVVVDVPPIAIAAAGTGVALTWDGVSYVAAWDGIEAARITPAGVVEDPTPIAVGTGFSPALASDGTSTLVVWGGGLGQQPILGARLAQDGAVLDPTAIPVSTEPSNKSAPAVTWGGSSTYVVAWADLRNAATTGWDIFGTDVSATGSVLFPDGFEISARPGHERAPALASLAGSALVAYTGSSQPVSRIAGRIVSPDSCTSDGDCTSGALPCLVASCFSGTCGYRVAAGTCHVGAACFAAGDLGSSNACMVCAPLVSQLGLTPVSDGTACSDGNLCTLGDVCEAGTCTPSSTVTCAAADQCLAAGTCDPSLGTCSVLPKPDGTACDDGDACSSGETCEAGTCGSATSTTACAPLDECHVAGVCNSADGTCSNPAAAPGTSCTGGTCQNGACIPNADAGVIDATQPDAPPRDATPDGVVADGAVDAHIDATPDQFVARGGGGCGCRTDASAPSSSVLAGAVVLLVIRRKRRAARELRDARRGRPADRGDRCMS